MLASERSLAAAHQSHNQSQCRQQPNGVPVLGKPRNGSAKPGARPVKIYVIDPRKLQQRLEAYVDQKNQKQVEANGEKEDGASESTTEATNQNEKTKEKLEPLYVPEKEVTSTKPTPALKTAPKVLPTIAPKLPTSSTVPTSTPPSIKQETSTVLGNPVALQCISATGYGLPVVVTNGVALLQPPISQSSMQASGIFLPGVSAIPNVITSGGTIIGTSAQAKVKSNGTTQKRKVKKRKVTKKRKLNDEKEKEAEEAELAYLLKETTTRTGRISRPVSQPNSPAFASLPKSISSTIPSPNCNTSGILPKVKKKGSSTAELALRCQTCLKEFTRKEELSSHFEDFQQHKPSIDNKSQIQFHCSTNVQGTSVSVPQSHEGSVTKPSESIVTIGSPNTRPISCTPVHVPSAAEPPIQLHNNNSNETVTRLPIDKLESNSSSARSPFGSYGISPDRQMNSVSTTKFFTQGKVTTANSSLVPDAVSAESDEIFAHCISSNVDVVPSSYSIPSSPPSQCQSPGLPDHHDITNKVPGIEGVHSPDPDRICNSPADPMLLRSRSPFLSHNPETSLHSVSVSNLSIPEESLCKGELFIDLGGGVLENLENAEINTSLPFRRDSSVAQLFSNSPPDPVKRISSSEADTPPTKKATNNNTSIPTSCNIVTPSLLETAEDANDGEIFQTAKYTGKFVHPSSIVISAPSAAIIDTEDNSVPAIGSIAELPKTPHSTSCAESDLSMDSIETGEQNHGNHKRRSIWQFVKEQIKLCGISQACGEISVMAEKLSRIARDQFIPIREDEIERLGHNSPIIHVDTPFFSHLLDLPFGTYVYKEDVGKRKKLAPPPPLTTSELSFTGGVEDVEKFLAPDIDLISLPHLTNLDLI